MGNVSLSIAALCNAKNLSELETWFTDIIILQWEGGELDKYFGILRIVKNALMGGGGLRWNFEICKEYININHGCVLDT